MLRKLEHYIKLLTLPLIYPAILGSLIFELIQKGESGSPTFAPVALWLIVLLYCLDYLVLTKWERRTDIFTQLSDIFTAFSFKAASIFVLSDNYDSALLWLGIVSLLMGVVIWRSSSDLSFKWMPLSFEASESGSGHWLTAKSQSQ